MRSRHCRKPFATNSTTVVSNIDYVSKQDFYDSTSPKQYPNGEFPRP